MFYMFLYVSDDPRCFRCFTEHFLITNNFFHKKATGFQLVGILANSEYSAYFQVATMVVSIKTKKSEKIAKTLQKLQRTDFHSFF